MMQARKLSIFVALVLAAGAAAAASTDSVYLCVDADGHKTYQNSDYGPSCRRIDGIIATVPVVEPSGMRAARPQVYRSALSPASFPRVDVDTQRLRDADRRHILEEELRGEQQQLTRLRAQFNEGRPQPDAGELPGSAPYQAHVQRLVEDIERVEGNIASLRRELSPQRY